MTAKPGRYVAGAVAGLALTASFTACRADNGTSGNASGGGSSSPSTSMRLTSAQEALSAASQKTADVQSFRATLSTSTAVSGQKTNLKGNLAVRLKPDVGMTFNVPSIDSGGKSTPGFSEVLQGDNIYLKVPALEKQTGKPWIGFSLSKLGQAAGIDVQSLENQGRQADPALNARMLTASKDVRSVGKETVGGVSTTHYAGTFALSDALAKLGSTERAQAQKIFSQTGLDTLKFNLWVDGRQLPRKLTLATPSSSKVDFTTTMNYTAFNAPVTITAPPKDQVADGSQLRPGQGGVPN